MPQSRRIGLMGGTFDPIHLGHLVTAEQARVDLALAEVVFIPAGGPWQKEGDVSDAEHRYLMTVLATAANPSFSVSRLELETPGPTYTVDTLRRVRKALQEHGISQSREELFFITGADAILNILSWKDSEECLELATFVAATRPGHDLRDLEAHDLDHRVLHLNVPALAISSTDVRERFAAGRATRYLVPREVEEYVHRHGLYGVAGHGLAAGSLP
ncbi:MAG: nicotinate-nucleotide adenylyltransferase [Nitriliruptorales bacterium]|nr:nicotinate-nucleotide adenylyltransferase [Nitriliruptorales bacterium]